MAQLLLTWSPTRSTRYPYSTSTDQFLSPPALFTPEIQSKIIFALIFAFEGPRERKRELRERRGIDIGPREVRAGVFSILAISISIYYRAKAPIFGRYDTYIDAFNDT
jgi:hypothetical protein